ncbi:MAG: GspL/Epsl periplasmic domain-containing protein [Planctomycetota bacterium]
MNKRCIGIDIGPDHLCAVQVSRTQNGFLVERVFTAKIRRAVDSPSDILATLFAKHDFDSHAETAVSIPGEAVLLRNIETDAATIEQLSATQDGSIPNAEQLVTKTYTPVRQDGPKARALLISVDRGRLRERLNILLRADMHPILVETALFAVNAAVVLNHPEAATGPALVIHIDRTHLTITITQDGSIIFARKLPVIAAGEDNSSYNVKNIAALVASETRLTYRKLFDSDIPSDAKLYLVPQLDNPKTIEAELANVLHCHITLVNPCARVQRDPKCSADTVMTIAEGLALRALSPDTIAGLNFLNALQSKEKPQFELKKELRTIAKLAAAVILVAIVSLFACLWKLEREHTKIQKQTAELFRQTLPDEKNIVNPLAQLEQKITSLQIGYASFGGTTDATTGPLDIMQQVTQAIPGQAGITVGSLLLSPDSVRITGTAGTFAPVYQWQQQLQQIPRFASVDVSDIQRLAAGQSVNFTIVIAMAEKQPK